MIFLKKWYKRHRRLSSLSVFLVLMGLFIFYALKRRDEIYSLFSISPVDLFFLILFLLLVKISVGLNIKLLIGAFNVDLHFKEWFGLYSIATMSNYLFPAKAGFVPMAVYLKARHRFEYSKFITLMLGFYLFSYLVNCALGMILVAVKYFISGEFYHNAFLFFAAVAVAIFLLLFIIFRVHKRNLITGFFGNVIKGFTSFTKQKGLVYKVLVVHIISVTFYTCRLFFAYRSLGIDADIISSALIGLITTFSVILSVTPANLGVREFFITFSSRMVGHTVTEGMMVAIIDRSIELIVTFVLGLVFSYILLGGISLKKKVDTELS